MIGFSTLLKTDPMYAKDFSALSKALIANGLSHCFF